MITLLIFKQTKLQHHKPTLKKEHIEKIYSKN